MRAAQTISRLIARYGAEVTIVSPAGTARVCALVQPVRGKAVGATEDGQTDAGLSAPHTAAFFGPPECALARGDRVICGSGARYRVARVETLCADGPVCCWALLRPEGEETPWNS